MHENTELQGSPSSNEEMRQLFASVLYGGRLAHLVFSNGVKRQIEASFDESTDEIVLPLDAEDAESLLSVTVDGYNTSYTFVVAALTQKGHPTRLPLPKKIRRQQRRAKARARAPRQWEIRYLDGDEITRCRSLGDISLDGLSMRGGAADENRFSGRVLTPVSLYDGTVKICSLVAELRNVTYVNGAQGEMTFGMALRALKMEEWRAWENAVNPILHPTTRDGRKTSDEVWGLFGKSGYFNLSDKQPEHFTELKKSHDDFNRILEKNPELGTHVMWHGGGAVQASLSSCMFYAHTSVLHQGAKAPGNGASHVVLRDMLIHSFEYLKQQPSLHYVAALHNAKVPFNRYAFWDFAERHKASKTADLIGFRLVEFDCSSTHAPTPHLTVTEARPDEFGMLAAGVERARGELYAEAFDQTAEKMSAIVSRLRWRDVGHDRERRIYIARDEQGQPLAAAIVDVSPVGSNLFSMFDAFTVVSLLPQEGKAPENAIRALLAVTRRWFARIGRKRFVWHDFDEQFETVTKGIPGVQDLGLGRLWLIKREIIGNLQEFWYTHMMRSRKGSGAAPKASDE